MVSCGLSFIEVQSSVYDRVAKATLQQLEPY